MDVSSILRVENRVSFVFFSGYWNVMNLPVSELDKCLSGFELIAFSASLQALEI